MSLKSFFQNRSLAKEENANPRQKVMKNLSEMRSVLILCSFNNKADIGNWERYFKNLSSPMKKIDIIPFINDKTFVQDAKDQKSDALLCPKDLNWLGKIKDKSILSDHLKYEYDLLIDINFENVYLLNWIFVSSRATLKVSSQIRSEIGEYADFMIKTEDAEKKQKLYIDQIFYYLQQINSNGRI